MMRFIKKDFNNVRSTLEYVVKRRIPTGIFLIYYVVVGTLALVLTPIWFTILCIYYKMSIITGMNIVKTMIEEA